MYVERTLEGAVARAAAQFPVVLVTGARQVGKTTLLRHASGAARTHVTLDDPLVAELARTDPALFIQRFPPPVLIDEIQYAPELLPYIKMAVDRAARPGLFWITGSQHFHLMKGVSESLVGRVAVISLLGLTRAEMSGQGLGAAPFLPTPVENARRLQVARRLTLRQLYAMIWRGTLPAIALDAGGDRDLFYGSYVRTYLQRDLRDLARVGDEGAFVRFLRAAAARTGQLLNLADIAREVGVTPNTAGSWLGILETTGIVHLLEPFHANVTQRLVKTPKLYFLDTGLATYLTAWGTPEVLESGAMSGPILETWIVAEILKSYWHNGLRPPCFYYRDRDRREIDVLIVREGTAYPVEIKKTASPTKADIRHFRALERLGLAVGSGAVICLAEEPLPLGASDQSVPAWSV